MNVKLAAYLSGTPALYKHSSELALAYYLSYGTEKTAGPQYGRIKVAVVPPVRKAVRRALTLKHTGTHDFHSTPLKNLPGVLEHGVKPSETGYLGRGGYFGAGAPAKGFEPTSAYPAVGVARGNPQVTAYNHPEHGASRYAIYPETVPLKPKDYVVVDTDLAASHPDAYKELRRRIAEKRLRVMPDYVSEAVFGTRPYNSSPGTFFPDGDALARALKSTGA